MTRKDYEKIAAVIANARKELPGTEDATIDFLAGELADLFQSENPRFDRKKWMRAEDPEYWLDWESDEKQRTLESL